MSVRILTVAALLCAALVPSANANAFFPDTIPLPNGWLPEGIAIGDGFDFYSGSRADGSVFKGDLRTGRGAVLVQGPGTPAVGMKVDRSDRLFVAGGNAGNGFVYSARDGRELARYQFTTAQPTFVNDVTLTGSAAYFTDSNNRQLYVLDFDRRGRLPAQARTLPLTGDLLTVEPGGFELNGIAATADGRRLIAVHSRTGQLFLVDPGTGDTEEVDLGGATLPNGDGLLLHGRLLYVVQNRLNQIAVVWLDRGFDDGRVIATITDPDFDVPTTIASKGPFLWAVNARFNTPPTPDTPYNVVRVDGR
jgi:sugar lactone lactonase YvrE